MSYSVVLFNGIVLKPKHTEDSAEHRDPQGDLAGNIARIMKILETQRQRSVYLSARELQKNRTKVVTVSRKG